MRCHSSEIEGSVVIYLDLHYALAQRARHIEIAPLASTVKLVIPIPLINPPFDSSCAWKTVTRRVDVASIGARRCQRPRKLKQVKDSPFAELGIIEPLCRALAAAGYEEPTPIQTQAIPELLVGHDLLGIAQTGTGKTAAFAVPIMQRLLASGANAGPNTVRALVLAPTRELAIQIGDDFANYGQFLNLRFATIFGGVGQNPQVQALKQGVDVLIATPGRLLDLVGRRLARLDKVSMLVLDEADRLLDMGFIRDVRRIVAGVPKTRQSLLFSATMPTEVATLARELLRDPVRVDVSPKKITVEQIDQHVVFVENGDKRQVLTQMLRKDDVTRAIVFTRTKHGANRVAQQLDRVGIAAEAIHGNKSQNARQRALESFKNGKSWVLVATDIAARGIDIDAVSHVFNFELPHEPESYVHRIGRTGRAGASGIAMSLCDSSERPRLRAIEKLIRRPLNVVQVAIDADAREDMPLREAAAPSRRPAAAPSRIASASGTGTRRRRKRRAPNQGNAMQRSYR
jgi:ATP-dependent RNA helicase RhlE